MRFPSKRLNHLSQKFITGVVLILLFTLAGTLFANSRIVGRFYLHEQRKYLRKISDQLEEKLENGISPDEVVQEIEKTEKVLIAHSDQTDDPDILAQKLRDIFREKGLGFQKFWLWDQDYEVAIQNGSQFRIYSQDKMHYSILVQYIPLDSELYAVAAIVPDTQEFIEIVNHVGFLINSFAILIAIALIFILTRHITNPLAQVQEFTKNISSREYYPLKIKTGDELEDVANSLNEMAHDLKTPISLVGMYACGIKDGLDDGSLLDTIIRQNDKMSQIVERLLHLSRMECKEHPCNEVLLDHVLLLCIEEHKIFFTQRDLKLYQTIESNIGISGNHELLSELFSNLLSNAAKYASSGCVKVELYKLKSNCIFRISNSIDNTDLDIGNIWQPFYVGESSRNRELSGTGLGLSIVKKIAEQFDYNVSCVLKDREISFKVVFPINE